jgi:hypothetical protein
VNAAGAAAGALRGRRGALHLYGEGNLPSLLNKKMANRLLARQRGISVFIIPKLVLRTSRLSLKVTITANTIAQDGTIF